MSKAVGEWDGSETKAMAEWVVRSMDAGYGVSDKGEPVADTPKIGFHLVCHPTCDMKHMQPGKLNAPQILRARKVSPAAGGVMPWGEVTLCLPVTPSHERRHANLRHS